MRMRVRAATRVSRRKIPQNRNSNQTCIYNVFVFWCPPHATGARITHLACRRRVEIRNRNTKRENETPLERRNEIVEKSERKPLLHKCSAPKEKSCVCVCVWPQPAQPPYVDATSDVPCCFTMRACDLRPLTSELSLSARGRGCPPGPRSRVAVCYWTNPRVSERHLQAARELSSLRPLRRLHAPPHI